MTAESTASVEPDDASLRVPVRTESISLGRRLTLENGEALHGVAVGFRLHGAKEAPVVLVLGGISANRHLAACADDPSPGWWQRTVGAGRAFDPEKVRILSIDYLGGAGQTAAPDEAVLSAVHTRDQARMVALLMDELEIPRLHCVVGASYGGMVALSVAELLHTRVRRSVVIGAAHESHPMATAIRSVQRDIVRLGVAAGHEADAVRIARALAVTTYRTAAEFARRFDVAPLAGSTPVRFPVQDYLDHQGRKFARTFSPRNFLLLSESCDGHQLAPEGIRAPVTLVGVDSDTLVPPWQLEQLGRRLPNCEALHIVSSIYGHDAFLKSDRIAAIIGECVAV